MGTYSFVFANEPEYLRAVIERIADHPVKQIDELLPWKIAA